MYSSSNEYVKSLGTTRDQTENTINEYVLEKDLEAYITSMANENNDFEESIRNTDVNKTVHESVGYSISNNGSVTNYNKYLNGKIINNIIQYEVLKYGDYITTIYLEYDVGKPFCELSLEEKYKLFNLRVMFRIGYREIIDSNIMSLLLQQLCTDKTINEKDTTIQIPIISFEAMNFGIYHGLPMLKFATEYIDFILVSSDCASLFKNIKVLVAYVLQNTEDRYKCIYADTRMILLHSKIVDFIKTPLIKHSKAMLLYFKPKNVDNICTNPILKQVTFKLDNNDYVDFNMDNINSIEILGTCVYILSFSHEFDSIEYLCSTLQNPNKEITNTCMNNTVIDVIVDCVDDVNDYEICMNVILSKVLTYSHWKISIL